MGKALVGFGHYSMSSLVPDDPNNDDGSDKENSQTSKFFRRVNSKTASSEDNEAEEDADLPVPTLGIEDEVLMSVAKRGRISYVFQRFG